MTDEDAEREDPVTKDMAEGDPITTEWLTEGIADAALGMAYAYRAMAHARKARGAAVSDDDD